MTARRLYIETMESILKNTNKIIIDKSARRARASCPICRCRSCRDAAAAAGRRRSRRAADAAQPARGSTADEHAHASRIVGAAVVVVLILVYSSSSSSIQTEQALVLQFGKPIRAVDDPGLHFKLPWQNVVDYDRRILDFEPPAEEVIASDQKRLVVDTYARFRITDPLQFYQSVGTELVARAAAGVDHHRRAAPRHRQRRAAGRDLAAPRRDHAADPRRGEHAGEGLRHRRRSTCASGAPICRRRTARRSTTA